MDDTKRVLITALILAVGIVLGLTLEVILKRFKQHQSPPEKMPVPNGGVVRKVGPSIYTTDHKRKPKVHTDKDLWERENPADKPLT